MLISPLQNTASFNLIDWIQRRSRITQRFGENPSVYAQFDMIGHNGVDFGVPVGTPIFAPCDGEIRRQDDGNVGYGKHYKLRSENGREIVLGHLSEFIAPNGTVKLGTIIGKSGDTGFSTGPHLHFGMRNLNKKTTSDIWLWSVLNYNNGFKGYVDLLPFIITWKGGFLKNEF